MLKWIEELKGKRTYLVALVAAGLVVARALGVEVPSWVLELLAAAGLITLRAGLGGGQRVEVPGGDRVEGDPVVSWERERTR